jgi:hypothetical protein
LKTQDFRIVRLSQELPTLQPQHLLAFIVLYIFKQAAAILCGSFGTSFNLFQHPKTRSIIFERKCHIFYQKEMKKNMFFFKGYPAILDTPFAIIKPESER